MQVVQEFRQTIFPNRALLICPVCKKQGYSYKRRRPNGHSYRYITHFNEPPIYHHNGIPKYRTCYDNSRLYETIEEAIKADQIEEKQSKIIKCPKCGKKGRLDKYHRNPSENPDRIYYVAVHESINGTWGKKGIMKKKRRCYLPKDFFESS